jgi:peptidoglycan/xylan/chitin deacetylase (PgdA/CDA1 family)
VPNIIVLALFFKFFILQIHSRVLKKLFPKLMWNKEVTQKTVYLTFDDGPTPEVTLWVLNELEKYKFKATFFCIGKNIQSYPEIFKSILDNGHQVGNHTQLHQNGWKTQTDVYIQSVIECESVMNEFRTKKSDYLFRPPYGKISSKQAETLHKLGYKIVMWSNLSEDYRKNMSPEKCFQNSTQSLKCGDIIVFHDSEKAFENLKKTLPKTLDYFKKNGFVSQGLF